MRTVTRLSICRITATFSLILALVTMAWSGPYHILHTFSGHSENPISGLVVDSQGNAYGVTNHGGYNTFGTVYQLSPTTGFHIIYAFSGSDGGNPAGNLAIDSAGNLYGTTPVGGSSPSCTQQGGCGVVFELSPPSGNGPWTFTTLYSFTGQDDGFSPFASVVFDSQGNLYGTTTAGGTFGCGVVFELSPSDGGLWNENVLYALGEDGCLPEGGLILDQAGNLYGTTYLGGMSDVGVVFQLSPSLGNWAYTVLHEFNTNIKDGAYPAAALAIDSAGSLYGTTLGGGKFGSGTVFELTPNEGTWAETILHNFAGGQNDGAEPRASLVLDDGGNVYGTTVQGGGNPGVGTVFRLKPNGNGTWSQEQFFFGTGALGGQPWGSVLLDGFGSIYGTAYGGGKLRNGENGDGVLFKLSTGRTDMRGYRDVPSATD